MALLKPVPNLTREPLAEVGHLRRCTFRQVSTVQRRPVALYDVTCLFPDRASGLPLGSLETARPICDSCTARGIFRPDED